MPRRSIASAMMVVAYASGAMPVVSEQPRPRAQVEAPPAQSPAEATAPKGTLKGFLTQIGPTIDDPDGDGKVLPITANVQLPEGKRVKSFAGTLTVRSLDDPRRELWSGSCEFDPDAPDDGKTSVFVNVPADETSAGYVELKRSPVGYRVMQQKGILGPPVEIQLDVIEYADGTQEKF